MNGRRRKGQSRGLVISTPLRRANSKTLRSGEAGQIVDSRRAEEASRLGEKLGVTTHKDYGEAVRRAGVSGC